jgi:hypothetical protein
MLDQSKLAFRAPFCLHGNMPPAEHSLTSLSATDERIHGLAVFATTHWSVMLETQGESAAAQKALEKLCRTYRRPIYDLPTAFTHYLDERLEMTSQQREFIESLRKK